MQNTQAKFRVVLDTNIIISALIFGGEPRKVTDLIVEKTFRPVMAEELITELRRVVIERFPKARHELEQYEKLLRRFAIWVPLGNHRVSISRDPDDDKFIETAVAGKCQYIVSGDKDLLVLKAYKDIEIVNATDFLKIYK